MRSVIERSFIEQARRRQVLQGAIELLAEGGSSAASLAAIADRVGVSKGVISYHFAGKDDLLRELVTSVLADAAAFMTSRVEAAGSMTDKLRAYVLSNVEYLSGHRHEILALTAVLNAAPPGSDGEPMYEANGQDAVGALTTLLVAGQRAGEFTDFSAPVVARSLRASIDAVAGLLRADPAVGLDAYAHELLALFERAVLA